MNTKALIFAGFLFASATAIAGGYEVGDKAADFKLRSTDGSWVSLSDFKDAKGFVVVFTSNDCPFSISYQERIKEIDKIYKPQGYPVIAINSNDIQLKPDDSMERMEMRSKVEGFTFPYLKDETTDIAKMFGATRTPEVFVLKKVGSDLIVKYIGSIDDNYADATKVTKHYLSDALDALIMGETPSVSYTKAVGCSIKLR
jgi:peroxiredoxin